MVKKNKKETPNTKCDPRLLSKTRGWDEYRNPENLLNNPTDPAWRERLNNTLLFWSAKKDSLDVVQFCVEYKIPYSTLFGWAERYEDTGAAYSNMKRMIASNRHVGSMRKDLDGKAAYLDIHRYVPEWHKEVNVYHSDLKKEEDRKDVVFILPGRDGKLEKPLVITAEEMKDKDV